MTATSTTDNMTAIGDLILDTTSAAQDAVLAVVETVGETVKPLTEKIQGLPFADLYPSASDTVAAAFAFAEKALANSKDFTTKLLSSVGV